jgi:hypothetical protein
MKQIRFWLWGLAIWITAGKLESTHWAAQQRMVPVKPRRSDEWLTKAKIYWVSVFFVAFSATLGFLFALLQRLFNIQQPQIVRTLVNYLSSIKLYNQWRRLGQGVPGQPADFLDAVGQPPRVSIRRRMVRTLADVALADYDRWYVLAHSLGSVVAFNGLMEPAQVFPNYLDEARWTGLVAAGLGGPTTLPATPAGNVFPERPGWLGPTDGAYRDKVFAEFGGLLTYGCPLGKFGAIWPALIPFCKEPAFRPGACWLNILDPMDPVSGPLRNLTLAQTPAPNGLLCCPPRTNVGYAAFDIILEAHVQYLTPSAGGNSLADQVARWLVSGDAAHVADAEGGRFFRDRSPRMAARATAMFLQWLVLNAFFFRSFKRSSDFNSEAGHAPEGARPDVEITPLETVAPAEAPQGA